MRKNSKLASKLVNLAVCCFILILATAFFVAISVQTANAQTPENMLWGGQKSTIQANTGLGGTDPRVIAANVIRVILGFLGIIAVILIMYGGFIWMMSGGNEIKISQAKKILLNASMGLIVVLAAFGIASFVLNSLLNATSGTGGSGIGGGGIGGGGGFGASGNSIIESHYPTRNQQNVPRNTSIIITFREAMSVGDLINGGNLNAGNIKIYKTADGPSGPYVTDVAAASTPDNKTFRFKPNDYLGSPNENIWYTVELRSAIRKSSGGAAFPGVGGSAGYSWKFEVSTIIDVRPPKIESIIPIPGSIEPRNVVIQVNFDEAIDPISASGPTSAFTNIETRAGGALVDGNFFISNMYQTVEFLTNDACGVNSCGKTIYCLPGNSALDVLVKAGTLVDTTESFAVFPFDGVADMASNSLDGNKNNAAQGPQSQSSLPPYNENSPDASSQGDDYIWSFNTNNTIDTTAPVIISINPASGQTNVGLDINPRANFNKMLMSSSLTKNSPPGSGSVALYPGAGSPDLFYWVTKVNDTIQKQTTVFIGHEFFPNSGTYIPEFNSNILDIYQNCYYPSGGPGCTPNPGGGSGYCCDGATQAGSCKP